MNLARNLERTARSFPQHPVIIQGDWRMTYAQLESRAARLAAGLVSQGIGPGDRVALCAPNSADWLCVYFAVLKLGAVAVTLSSQLSTRELGALLSHAKPKKIFAGHEQLSALREIGQQAVALGVADLPGLLAAGGQPVTAVERDPRDVACVLYTGGTTGIPKGVMLSHENINTAIHNVVRMEGSTEDDRALCFLPFNHVFGQMHIMNATVLSGGALVMLPGFSLEGALEAIAELGVTKLYAVPTVYVRLLQLPDLKTKLGKVRYCFSAAASLAREHVVRWKEANGLAIHEAYGMTETASMVTYNHHQRHVVGSVGEAVGATEVSIRDIDGNPLPQGSQGEICIRGRNVMLGYLDNVRATQEAFFGRWLRSGDIGYLDDHGYLFIVDRIKDMIITGGENVYPREVEEVLYTHQDVKECAVIGLPDAEYGERVTAYLVMTPGDEPDGQALKAFCKTRLSPFKVPKRFIAVESLPTTAAGKILKRELRRAVIQQEKA